MSMTMLMRQQRSRAVGLMRMRTNATPTINVLHVNQSMMSRPFSTSTWTRRETPAGGRKYDPQFNPNISARRSSSNQDTGSKHNVLFYIYVSSAVLIVYIIVDITLKEKVPAIGRKRLLLLPLSTEKNMGLQQFKQIKAQSKVLPDSHPYVQMVKSVGNNIKAVAGNDLGFKWEFIVVDEPVENAFCLPGGKVVFYKGLMDSLFKPDESQFGNQQLEYREKESLIASVMAHEISHALLRHHAEQISLHAKLGIASALFQAILGGSLPGDQLLMNVGVLLPFSRKHEYEADLIGLYLMSRACYEPKYAIKCFEKMQKSGDSALLNYISTHPSFGNRLEVFREHLGNAERERAKFCYSKHEELDGRSGRKRKSPQYWWTDLNIYAPKAKSIEEGW